MYIQAKHLSDETNDLIQIKEERYDISHEDAKITVNEEIPYWQKKLSIVEQHSEVTLSQTAKHSKCTIKMRTK